MGLESSKVIVQAVSEFSFSCSLWIMVRCLFACFLFVRWDHGPVMTAARVFSHVVSPYAVPHQGRQLNAMAQQGVLA
jgi:hypothetical protein